MSRRFSCHLIAAGTFGILRKSPTIQLVTQRAFCLTSVQNTWVLKRQRQLPLIALREKDKFPRDLILNYQIYEPVDCTHRRPSPPIELLLLKDVPGHGKKGHIVTVKRNIARMFLIPEGKATYVTPEGIAYAEEIRKEEALHPERQASSATAESTVTFFSNNIVKVPMSMHNPWKLERWHVRSALRQFGVWCPSDEVIELPKEAIVGPHPDMHGKCFSVFVTINGRERGCLLCSIELRCKDPADALVPLDYSRGKPTKFDEVVSGAVSEKNTPPTSFPPQPSDKPRVPRYRTKDF